MNTTKEDTDVILVQQFIEVLSNIAREMEPLKDTDTIGYVLITKLKRVYEKYKDTALSNNSFDSLIDYYSYLQIKEKKEKVVEKEIPLFLKVNKAVDNTILGNISLKGLEKKIDDLVQKTKETKEPVKITSTYKGYPVEIKLEGDKLYSCTIKTRYGIEDTEISKKPLDYVLYHQQITVDNYKTLIPPTDIYHQVDLEYKDFIFKSYYSYNTNQLFLRDIYNSKEKKYIKKEDLGFDPHNRTTQELIDQFITFVDSKTEEKKAKELENIDTGIFFEYKRITTKLKLLDFDSGKCFNCVDGTIVDSTILGLYEKFKNAINSKN